MSNTDKPRIRWWGNGDVLASCCLAYRACYPNTTTTFRTKPQSIPKGITITRLEVSMGSKGNGDNGE